MTTLIQRSVVFGVVLGLVSAGIACTKSAGRAEQGSKEGILQFGNDAEPQELDPYLVTGYTEHKLLVSMFEGLVTLNPKTLDPLPGVAESWSLSDDGLVYRFVLRKNAKWSNGDPVTTKDFLFSWRRILSPKLAAEYSYMLHCIKNAKAYNDGAITDFAQVGARAIDDYNLEVTLENPTPYFLTMQMHLTYFPVHQATIEKAGPMDQRGTKWTRPETMVSNGPFKLTAWEPGRIIAVRKCEHYWDKANVRLNGIDFYPIESLETSEKQFRAGDLHLTSDIPLSKIDVYKKEHPEFLKIVPVCGTYFYRLNTTHPPLTDARVRRALALAIDREAIVSKVTRGGEIAATSITPPNTAGYTCGAVQPFDVPEARRLLAEAGFSEGKGMPPVELLYNTSENHKLIAEAVQQMWKLNLNVDVNLVNQDWKVYLDTLNNLGYDLARSAWWADVLDPMNFLECFLTDGGNNRTGWSSPAFDALVAEARRTLEPTRRNELFQQAEKILLDEAPIAPVYYYTRKFLMSPDVKGLDTNMLGYFNYRMIYLEHAK